MRFAREKNGEHARLQGHLLLVGDSCAQLVVLFFMPGVALTGAIGHAAVDCLLALQQDLNINKFFVQLRFFTFRRLRGEAHDVHINIIALQLITPRFTLLRLSLNGQPHGLKQNG